MERSGAGVFCCPRVPLAAREELRIILRMTGPLLLSRVLHYLLPFVITMFCGRLGNKVLAGYGLASAAINISTAATGIGLALACDTLVSQTFGGQNLLRVGIILQRGILILLLFCLPCWGLLINTQAILLALGQDPEVARIVQLYVIAYLPAVPMMFLHHLQASYLQNQGIILPQMYTAALANVANLLTHYILLRWMDLGVNGSAAANTLSQVYICGFLFLYIWWKKLHVDTWGGWSLEALQEWGSYMKLAIPSMMMVCFEWWIYEFGGFLTGLLSENELAAQHTVITVTYITYMFPLAVQVAACMRVGNALGAGDTAGAILTSKVSLAVSAGMAVAVCIALVSSKTVIGFIFTSDQAIVDLVSLTMNVYCVLHFFEGLVCVCTGILLGSGRQKIAAVANLVGYYCIGLPLIITLMFVAKLRVLGFWLGLLISISIQSAFYITVIFKFDWEKMTEEAVKRAQKNVHVALTAAESDALHTEDPEQRADSTSVNGCVPEGEDGPDTSVGAQSGCAERRSEVGAPRLRLSAAQLVLRRGLTALAMVLVLAAGIGVHSLLPLPETLPPEGNLTAGWTNATDAPCCILHATLDPGQPLG